MSPHWTESVCGFGEDGFAVDKSGNRIEIVCTWCGGDGCDACAETGFVWATERDVEEWA